MDLTEEERPEQHAPLPVRQRRESPTSVANAPEAVPIAPAYVPYVPSTSPYSDGDTEHQSDRVDLPEPGLGGDLSTRQPRARWTVLVFAIALVVYLAFLPRFLRYSNPPTGDQPFYLMDTISLVEDGDLNVFNNYAKEDARKFYPPPPEQRAKDFVGISAPFPLPAQLALTPARPENEWYSAHMPGLSFVIAPGWWVGSWFGQGWPGTIVVVCILGALLGANVFLAAYQITGRMGIAIAVWAAITFASPIWSYSYLIFTEMPTGLLLIYAFRRLAMGWGANESWRLAMVGAAIGFIPWMAWRCVPLALVLGLYAVVQWVRYRRQGAPDPESRNSGGLKAAAAFLAPLVAFGALVAAYTYFRTGSIIPNTAQQARDVVEPFNWPWQGAESFTLFVRAIFGQLYDQRFGLLVYSPIYLLAIVGIVAMFRTGRRPDRRLLVWIAALVLPYYFLLSAYAAWHGIWSPPSRYLATLAPLAAFPLAMSASAFGEGARSWARWLYRVVYALFVLVGLALMGVMLADARTMWPLNDIFGWIAESQDAPFHMDLRQFIPLFIPFGGDYRVTVGDYDLPRTTALWVGGSVLLVLVLVWAMNRGGATRRSFVPGWRPSAQAAMAVGLLAVVGAGWFGMNAEFFQPVTLLTPVQTWKLPEGMKTPRGITLHDGKIYMTDYDGPSVNEFDLASGTYRLIQATVQTGTVPYTHPGDVQFGPDGLFYVLNNGTGQDALYAMTLDGQVQRRIALDGHADISVGLRFTGDGRMLISDMRRGVVLGYGMDGGAPVMEGVGEGQRGMNNLNGITLDADGNIYAFESSGFRVQVLDSKGQFLRDYKLKCMPMYGEVRDGWLDVTCDLGLVSIDLATGRLQPARVANAPGPSQFMLGMTYGPDGTLYVMQEDGLHAYRVQH